VHAQVVEQERGGVRDRLRHDAIAGVQRERGGGGGWHLALFFVLLTSSFLLPYSLNLDQQQRFYRDTRTFDNGEGVRVRLVPRRLVIE
jgi:hypothetical protein